MGFFERMKIRRARDASMREFRKDVTHDPGMPGVPGVGHWRSPAAMLIQDRPGDGKWQGFFNRATGKIYAEIMEQEGVPPSDVYVTSALKSKTPHDRSIEYEIAVWRPYLERELRIVRPYCLLVVGKLARRVLQDIKGTQGYGRQAHTT